MDPTRFRAHFPVTERLLFLNHASETPMSTPIRQRITEYFDAAALDPDAAPFFQAITRVPALLSQLLGGSPDEYALMPNTATGINTVALGLDWKPGDNVVIPAEEYPAMSYPWLNLRRQGVEVRVVPLEKNLRVDPDRIASYVDDRTRVVAVSAVEYLSGFRNDLPRISQIAHARGALFVVDAIQAAGALPIHVDADGIDVLAAGGYKWLTGPVGTGFAYFSRSTWEQIRPVLPGAFSSVEGVADAAGRFTLQPNAMRYMTGCLPFQLHWGWTAGLELLLEAGIENTAAQIRLLTDRLIAGLQVKGITIATPVGRKSERSGIISFTLGSAAANEALVKRLHEQQIIISYRGERCRVSPHFYNTEADIDRLLEAL